MMMTITRTPMIMMTMITQTINLQPNQMIVEEVVAMVIEVDEEDVAVAEVAKGKNSINTTTRKNLQTKNKPIEINLIFTPA